MQEENLSQMIAQRDELDAQIKAARADAVARIFVVVASALASAGITSADAAQYFSRAAKKAGAHKNAGKKVPPKYRHKATGQTWTGRGKQPAWYAGAEQSEIEFLRGDLA